MTATYNLVVPQATTFQFVFTINESNATTATQVPWNLTGYTATMTVRPFAGSSVTTLLATTANGKIILGGIDGRVTVNFTAEETNIKPEPYVYDLVLYSGGTVTRMLEGQFLVVAGVTV